MSIWEKGIISIDWPRLGYTLRCDGCDIVGALLLETWVGKEQQEIKICPACLRAMTRAANVQEMKEQGTVGQNFPEPKTWTVGDGR